VNYLAEINAFYDRLELNPQPNTAIALWHALMSIANKAGWPDTFTVASSILGFRAGLNDSALKRARNKLAMDGLIEWKSRGGNQSAQYRMISLVVQNQSKYEPQFALQSEPQFALQNDPQSEPINKLKQKHINLSDRTREEKPDRFDEFWRAYPRKADLLNAQVEYICLLETTSALSEDALIAAARNYAETCQIRHTKEQYIKYAANWLKESNWIEYLPENYKKPQEEGKKLSGESTPKKDFTNRFNNVEGRKYNYNDLEKQLVGR